MATSTPSTASASGIQYAVRILIGTAIVWLALYRASDVDPLWAVISIVVVSEPQIDTALLAFKSRVANTLIGSSVGLAFLFLLGPAPWSVLLAMAVSIVACTSLVRVPVSWKIAPITVALVMMPAVLTRSRTVGLPIALRRTGEVIFGSAVAVAVSFVASKLQRHAGKPSTPGPPATTASSP